MAQVLIDAVLAQPNLTLSAMLASARNPLLGQDAGLCASTHRHCNVPISEDYDQALGKADCLIDFTRPEATLDYLRSCQAHQTALVIGTTGFDDKQKETIRVASQTIPIVYAPNMSIGVNLIFKLIAQAAHVLATHYDIEIIEAHHRHKVDAPSGTALRMGEILAHTLGWDLSACALYGRQGHTGERPDKQIGFSTVRGGDIVGDHTVLFAGIGERIEISHKAGSRMPYALGALRAAEFLQARKNGLYDMQDVLGLK